MGHHSYKRLFVLGVLLIGFSFAAFGSPLAEQIQNQQIPNPFVEQTQAQDDNCPNAGGPCQFPADRYAGGIILGSSNLVATSDGVTYLGPSSTTNLPPDSVEGSLAETAKIGFNVASVQDLWVYKTWKTPRSGAQTQDPANYDDVYVYISTSEGDLQGTSACTNENECDLVAETAEISIREIYFAGEGDIEVGSLASADGRFYNYWVNEPEVDGECDLESIVSVLFGVSVNGFCLGAASPGSNFAGIGFTITELELWDIMVRAHTIKADRANGVNRNLDLQDFYAEIRWGKGHDRAKFPTSAAPNAPGTDSEYAGPAEGFGAGFQDSSRSGGLTNPWACEGNPTTDSGDTNCNADNPDYRGSIKAGPYDDIYR